MSGSSNVKPVRVAVYTRKSVSEGLDQAFNTLDAQRAAVEAFVASQAGNGWVTVDEAYDDGGFSGATTDRPAFQRLLQDVEDGKVDVVAVYRLDRLSRSLADFAQLMRVLDDHGVAFVSVTEHFETSSPAGRMLMNLLATFAQFERESIAQRTRDKMQATRRRGMWTGGRPVLGYDVVEKRLVVNEDEAATVRRIFQVYLDLGGCVAVAEELRALGIRNKTWVGPGGKQRGGGVLDKNTVLRLLRNPLYVGQVRAGDETVDGDHAAIVDREIWDAVQARLDAQRPNVRPRSGRRTTALLAGIARCRCGAALTPSSSKRGNRRYVYYVCSKALKTGAMACPGSRIAATTLEEHVVTEVRRLARSPEVLAAAVEQDRTMRDDERRRIRTEVADLRRARGQATRRQSALVETVSAGDAPASVMDALRDVETEIAGFDERAEHTRSELRALDAAEVDADALRAALEEFDGVWDRLTLEERGRLLDLLLKEVRYDGRDESVQVAYRERPTVDREEAA